MDINLLLAALYGIVLAVLFQTVYKRHKTYKKRITKVKADKFEKLKVQAQLIDVRSKDEFKQNKILGARNIPIGDFGNIESKLLKNKSVCVYCASGKRALKAGKKLANAGYINVIVLNDKLSNYKGKMSNL